MSNIDETTANNIRAAKALMELAEKREFKKGGYSYQTASLWQGERDRDRDRDRAVRLTGQKSPHFTRSGPGRIHNHSGTEKQFWMFSYPLNQFVRRFDKFSENRLRERLNRFTGEFKRLYSALGDKRAQEVKQQLLAMRHG